MNKYNKCQISEYGLLTMMSIFFYSSHIHSSKVFYLTFFFIFVFLEYLIRMNVFGESFKLFYLSFTTKHIIVVSFVFFSMFYAVFYTLDISNILSFHNPDGIVDNIMHMSDDGINVNNNTVNKGINVSDVKPSVNPSIDNNSVTISNPRIQLKISDRAVNNAVAAVSSSGGAVAAVRVLHHFPGGPTAKALAAVSTMSIVQGTTYIMSKSLNNNSVKNSLVYISGNSNVQVTDLYPNYPLNLLYDMQTLVNGELLAIILIIHILIVQAIITMDYSKYIPNNKLGKYINIFLNRYIKLYSKSNKFLLGLCVFNLFIGIVFSKFCLYQILNP